MKGFGKTILRSLSATVALVATFPGYTGPGTIATADRAKVADWPYVNHDAYGTRYSALSAINTHNAAKLQKVCSYEFPEKAPAQTAPVVIAGVIYASSAHYTVAIDGSDCHAVWVDRWEPRGSEPFTTQRGVAFADGRIVRGTSDGYLLALDVKDGHRIWARSIADPREGYFISMPPLIEHGLVYVGPGGAETASSGWVGAFRLSDGEEVWRFHIIPLDGEPGAETWGTDPEVRKHAGGNLWTALSFDKDRQLLYVPGGNPAPDFYDVGRPGENLYTNSLIALDANTGALRWYKQLVAHDVRDYDLTHVSPVIRVQGRTLIVTTGKDGLLRALDAATHEIVYAKPFTTLLNNEGSISTSPMRTCPGALGGDEWNGAAYSSRLRLIFTPATDWCAEINRDDTPPDPAAEHSRGNYFGGKLHFDPWDRARGWLTAFEASSGETRWRYGATKPIIGAVTATAGDVVLTGELTGDFLVLDARSGRVLFRENIGAPIAGGIVTYASRGTQAVALVSGYVGVFNLIAPEIGGGNPTVTVFRLSK